MASDASRLFTYGELRSVLAGTLLSREDATHELIDRELDERVASLPGRAVPDLVVPMTPVLLGQLVAYAIAHGAGRLDDSTQDSGVVLTRWLDAKRDAHEFLVGD